MFKKILALALVFCLCLTFAGCGAKNTSSDGDDSGESGQFTVLNNKPDDWDTNWTAYYEMDADGNPVKLTGDAAPEFVAGKYLAKGLVQKSGSGSDDGADADSANSDSGSGKSSGDNKKVNAKATKTTKFAADPFSDVPDSVKGTTVEYLMCREVTDNDRAIVKGFEEKSGIKVKLTYAEYGSYGDTVANRVAAGNVPDIINGERLAYPNAYVSLCEPMDKYTFKLEDDFWDYDSMSAAKIKGSYYGVNSKKSIYHDARMLMINVPLLKNILGADYATKSPRALWKSGNWNLEALYNLCAAIKDKDGGYTPLTYISQYDFALASGQDLVTFNGTKFVSNLSNSDLRKAWEWFSKIRNSEGFCEEYNMNNFLAQKDVMFINTVYNCYNKNSIAGMASFEVDAVPVPGVKVVTNAPCDFRTYSIAKGAKNPVGAAYFLRYLLDNENYNPYEKSEATNANVWETAVYVSQKMTKTMEFSSSLLKYVSDTAEGQVRTALLTSNQMSTAFAKIENQVNNAVKRVNKSVLKVE